MKLNQEKIQRMFNGQGIVAGGGGSSFDPSVLFGLATEQWTEENYVSKTFFNELFVIHKLTTTVVYDENDQEISRTTSKLGTFLPNELPSETETVDEETGYKTVVTTAVDNIEAKKGVWTNFFMSALGLNDAGGGGGVGDVTWDALEDDTDYRQIALSHLTTALQNYATQTWVQTQGYVTQSAISDMATKTWVGQQGFLTSSAISDMATKTWVGQQGYLTSSAISDMATKTWVGQQGFITSVTGTFWGRTFTNGGTVTGTLESVQHIQMTGHLYMHYGGTGIYLNSDGTGIDWHDANNDYVSSLLAFTSGQVQFNQDAYIPASKILRLGDAVFEWDSTNNAVKVRKATGANDAVNFYATGGVSALGYGASGGGGTGDVTWELLADNTDTRQIALSHLTTALSGYATQNWVQGAYLPLTGGILTSNTTPVLSLTSALEYVTLNMACSVNGTTTTRVSIGYDNDMAFLAIVAPGTTARIGVDVNGQPQFRSSASSSTASLIWTSGNDGAGSGMDADLLDGQHGSYYATASQLSDYLPLTAGSSYPLTGELFLNEGINVLNSYSSKGHFGKTSFSWLGGTFPTLYSLDGGGSAYMMITTPHIPFLQNGSRGYTGISYGSIVRFEGGITESEYWDLGIPSSDTFKISRSGVELFRINSNGNVGVAHDNPAYKLHVGGTFCATSVAVDGGTSSQFLKADGTTDANSYALVSSLSGYLPLTGGTISGSLTVDYNLDCPLTLKGSSNYNYMSFFNRNSAHVADAGWLDDTRGNYAYILNYASTGALSVNGSGCYYSVDAGNTLSQYTIYHTGNISSASVASAATLTTSRTIWGQSFNGSANITGAMSSVTNINSILYFDTTNNRIGVNTSSPSEALNINGGLYATATSYFSDNVYIRGGSGVWSSRLFVGTPSSDLVLLGYINNNVHGATVGAHNSTLTAWAPLYLLGTSVNLGCMESVVATIASNLCFGIGTTSPSHKLHVVGAIYSSSDIMAASALYVGTGMELNTGGAYSVYGGYIDFHYAGSSRDYTARIIENEENILSITGISNTSGSAVRAGLKVGDGYNASYVQIGNIRLVYNDSTNSIRVVRYDGTAANLYATGGISALGISSGADGTVSASLIPSTTGTYELGSSSYGWKRVYLSSNSSNSYTGTISVDADGINLISSNGGYLSGTRFLVNGRLVVNESDDLYPSYALYVNGNTYCEGSISASNVINRSDMRLKDVLDDLKLDLQTIANAPLFKFTFRKGERRVMVGTSAQYWQVLLPEAVFADADGMLGLDYGVTALASAISLAREVSDHDRRIAQLEAENMVLRAEIKNLKAA